MESLLITFVINEKEEKTKWEGKKKKKYLKNRKLENKEEEEKEWENLN